MGVDALPVGVEVASGGQSQVENSGLSARAFARLSHLNNQSCVLLVALGRLLLSVAPQAPRASVTGSPAGGGTASGNPRTQLEACLSGGGDRAGNPSLPVLVCFPVGVWVPSLPSPCV